MYKILKFLSLIVLVTNVPSLLAMRIGNLDYIATDLNDETTFYTKRRIVVDCGSTTPTDLSEITDDFNQENLLHFLGGRIEKSTKMEGYKEKDLEVLFREISSENRVFNIKVAVKNLGYERDKHVDYNKFLMISPLLSFTCSANAPEHVKKLVKEMLEQVRDKGLI